MATKSVSYVSQAPGPAIPQDFIGIPDIASQDRLLVQVVLFLHLSATAFWVGILAPLKSLARAENNQELVADLGARFGYIASGVVPLLILAGIVMT